MNQLEVGKSYIFPSPDGWAPALTGEWGAPPPEAAQLTGQIFKVDSKTGTQARVKLGNGMFMTLTPAMFNPGTTFETAESYQGRKQGEVGVALTTAGIPQDVIRKLHAYYKVGGKKTRRRISKRKSTRKLKSRSRQ